MYLAAGFVESAVRRFRSHRIPASQARFVMFLNRAGLHLPYQLLCTCLSLGTGAEAFPIQPRYSRPTDMVVELIAVHMASFERASYPALFWKRNFGVGIHPSREFGLGSVANWTRNEIKAGTCGPGLVDFQGAVA